MPTLQTKHLTGRALDWAAALATGKRPSLFIFSRTGALAPEHWYSTDWSQGGPIIEHEKINLETRDDPDGFYWVALVPNHRGDGPTALIAAMRCLVASKLGPTVDIPQDLLTNQGAS